MNKTYIDTFRHAQISSLYSVCVPFLISSFTAVLCRSISKSLQCTLNMLKCSVSTNYSYSNTIFYTDPYTWNPNWKLECVCVCYGKEIAEHFSKRSGSSSVPLLAQPATFQQVTIRKLLLYRLMASLET